MFNKLAHRLMMGIMFLRHRWTDDELTPAELAEVDAALGDALRVDGSIDFERLKQLSEPLDLAKIKSP